MRFEKVIAINPQSPPGYVANRDSLGGYGQLYPIGAIPFPPLDLPYLAGYLVDKGIQVSVLESLGLGLDVGALVERIASIAREKPGGVLAVVRTPAGQEAL
jgi:hypothetical protein